MTNPKNNYRNLIEIKHCILCEISNDEIPLKYLEVDHINGNHFDNREENLQVLCKACHSIKSKFSSQGQGLLFYFLSKLADESKLIKDRLYLSANKQINRLIKSKNETSFQKKLDLDFKYFQRELSKNITKKEIAKLLRGMNKEVDELRDLGVDVEDSLRNNDIDKLMNLKADVFSDLEKERFKDKDYIFINLPYLDKISDNWLNVMSLFYKHARDNFHPFEGNELSWMWFICEDIVENKSLKLYFNNERSLFIFQTRVISESYTEYYTEMYNHKSQKIRTKDTPKTLDFKKTLKAFIYHSYGKKLDIELHVNAKGEDKVQKNEHYNAVNVIEEGWGYSMLDKKNKIKINNYSDSYASWIESPANRF